MPQVEILAGINGLPSSRFVMFSELENKPAQADYSGMSGGPIFWSTESHYVILGIIYEAGVGTELSDRNSIYVYGELATPQIIKGWLNQVIA